MDLTVETGASLANLDLQGLQLEKLDIEAGVGDLTVNLGGDWKRALQRLLKQVSVKQRSFYPQRLA